MNQTRRVLLAEDDQDDVELLTEAFRKLDPDIEIVSVSDGRLAVEWLERCTTGELPLCVILDYNMPHLSAPQVLDLICAEPRFDHLPKFVWSTAANPEFIEKCKGKGIIEYFVKPTLQSELENIASLIIHHCSQTA